MARPKGLILKKKINVTVEAEDLEVVNYVLRPVGVSVSSFLSSYLHQMAEAIKECGITHSTMKDFTVGEVEQTFEKLQLILSKKKDELAELQQTILPGLEKQG